MKNPLLQLVDLVGNLLDRVKRLEVLTDPQIQHVPAQPNWHGVPKPDLTWEEVSKGTQEINPIIPMTIEDWPERCPKCNGPMSDYRSDWEYIEDGGQYMVRGIYCEKGHWTRLDWA